MKRIQPPEFVYEIIVGTTPYRLAQSPIGWEENVISFKRDTKYWGVIRDFTLPLRFISEGAKILRSQYYFYGIEAQVRLQIYKLNNLTWIHEPFYLGDIDFSKSDDQIDTFTCNVMQGGISKMIKAYENVKYEIDLDVPEAVDIEIPGIGFTDYANSVTEAGLMANVYPAINLVINKLLSGDATAQNTVRWTEAQPDPDNWAFRSNKDGLNARIYGRFSGETQPANGVRVIRMIIMNGGNTGNSVYQPLIFNGSGAFDVTFDFNVTLGNGQRVFFDTVGGNIILNSSEVNMSYSSVVAPVISKALRPKYVLEQLLRKINNNNPVPVTSYLLDNTEWKNLTITSGDGIRQIPGAKIKTSLKDFFTSYDAVLCAGMGINSDSVIFEERESFFTDIVTSANVGKVKDCKFEPALEYFYSSLKAGYKDQSYNELDGKDEFNSEQEWTLPITRVQKELNIQSVYRADVRGIEDLRINFITNPDTDKSTDSDSDNDVFFVKIRETPETGGLYKPVMSEAFTDISGVNSPELMYNMEISLKKNLLRHSAFIKSFLDRMDGYLIRFGSATKNAEFSTTDLNGIRVKENENITVESLEGQLFKPLVATFECNYPKNIQALIESNPYGSIIFEFEDNIYKGFILEVSTDATKNSQREFRVLLTSSNNLLNLIR